MMRNVVFSILLVLNFSCSCDGGSPSGNGMHSSAAYENRVVQARSELFRLAVGRNGQERKELFIIGPIEILGNNGVAGTGYRPHSFTDGRRGTFAGSGGIARTYKSGNSVAGGLSGDSIILLLHYSYIVESDTVYEVTEGTLSIPLEEKVTLPLYKFIIEHLSLKNIYTRGVQGATLGADNLIL